MICLPDLREGVAFLVEMNTSANKQRVPDRQSAVDVGVSNFGHVLPEGLLSSVLDEGVPVGDWATVVAFAHSLGQKLGYVNLVGPNNRRPLFYNAAFSHQVCKRLQSIWFDTLTELYLMFVTRAGGINGNANEVFTIVSLEWRNVQLPCCH